MRKNRRNFQRYQHINEDVEVTKHAIERFKERREKDYISEERAQKEIISQVKLSRLISVEGDHEHRQHLGYIYVVKRESNILGDKLIVKTIKLSNSKKRQHLANRWDEERPDIVENKIIC